ncbi:MAG: nitroreductase family protein [Bacillota bacterium]
MDILEAIKGRRSVRLYKNAPVDGDIIRELIGAAVYAPTGSNLQPWLFAVIENRDFMKKWSDLAKKHNQGNEKIAGRYKAVLENPDINLFYNAPALIAIYGNRESPTYMADCSMAALNFMLAAYNKGLGTCWIGLAVDAGDLPEIRDALKIPDGFKAVAPIILGYPEGDMFMMTRKDPVITEWLK